MPRTKRPTPTRCTFAQGGRRCPYDGEGTPRLCRAHQLVIQQAAVPKPPASILLDAAVNFLQGKPINQEAALGAAEELLSRWTGMGSDYHPDIDGVTEGQAHQRAQAGQRDAWWQRVQAAAQSAGQRQHAPPPPDPDAALREARRAARVVMGFDPVAPLDVDTVKRRHRELVRKHHPDRGRTPERVAALTKKMAAINNANDVLLAEIEGR